MNNKTNPLEDYVNFVDSTAKQNTCYKRIIFLCALLVSSLFFVLFKYINE